MGCEMSLSRKELGEVLIHSFGDTMMLATTKRRQLSAIALGVLPYFLQSLTDILAQRRQILLILKLLVYPDIPVIICQPARTMSPIMRYVKRLIALWSLFQNGLSYRVGIIHASHFLVLGM